MANEPDDMRAAGSAWRTEMWREGGRMSTHGGGPRERNYVRERDIHIARELRAKVEHAENELRHRRTEFAYAWDRYGNLIAAKNGTRDQVQWEDWQLARFNGATMTHNHPSGNSLSPGDVLFAAQHDVAEMRAVGAQYRYSIRPPRGGWDAIHSEWHDTLNAALEDATSFWLNHISHDYRAGSISEQEAQLAISHNVIRSVAREWGFTYRSTRWRS